jgi:hypothetical protein
MADRSFPPSLLKWEASDLEILSRPPAPIDNEKIASMLAEQNRCDRVNADKKDHARDLRQDRAFSREYCLTHILPQYYRVRNEFIEDLVIRDNLKGTIEWTRRFG